MTMKNKTLEESNIPKAIAALQRGECVILVDDASRENEGDLVCAGSTITDANINFMVTQGRGLVCLALAESEVSRLDLPMMTSTNQSPYGTPFTVSIEAATGVTTGISAADRARTIRVASDPNSTRADIVVPGHIFPLRAKPRGVFERAGQTEGSVDLMRIAGLPPAAVICEILNDDGTMARIKDLRAFAKKHHLHIVHIRDIIQYRLQNETLVHLISEAQIPTEHGMFDLKIFETDIAKDMPLALVRMPLEKPNDPVPVRIHSECLTGDAFGSLRCDCGWQLNFAKKHIAKTGGVIIYLRQEGRGIGLANKIRAYGLQDVEGIDTVEANQRLGFAPDLRDYGTAAQILRSLNIKSVQLLTNNPEKVSGLKSYGIEVVKRIPIEAPHTEHNQAYLQSKKKKMGHILNSTGVS